MKTSDRAATYERLLFEHVVAPWFPRCVDRQQGGFVQGFDAAWNPVDNGPKFLEFQARQTLAAAELAVAYPSLPWVADAARHGFTFLRDVMWDARHGGWFVHVWPPTRDHCGDAKHAHGTAYAITACLAVHRVDGCGEALALAREAIDWLDRHAHDDDHGGYWGPLRRDGSVVREHDAGRPDTDHIGTPVGLKDLNVLGDLLESFSYAAALLDDRSIAARRDELADIVVRVMRQGDGPPCHFFDRKWQPVPTLSRPGTVVHNASRLLEIRDEPGTPPGVEAVVDDVIDRVFRHAWRPELDAIPMDYRLDRPMTDWERADVQWWCQIEALRVLEYRLVLSPGDATLTPRRDRVLGSLLEDYVDTVDGGIRSWSRKRIGNGNDGVSPEQRLWHACKSNEWKDASHDTRALLRLLALDAGAGAICPLGGARDRPVPAYFMPAPDAAPGQASSLSGSR